MKMYQTMGKKRWEMKKKRIWIICIVLCIVLTGAAAYYFLVVRQKEEPGSGNARVVAWDVDIDAEENTAGAYPGIQIPGYQEMVFKADEKEQSVNIGNPEGNNCYFKITLKVQDGDKLFTSGYLQPGEGFEKVELDKTLKAGEYTGIIQYQCYSLEDKSVLNGASSEFQLIVME